MIQTLKPDLITYSKAVEVETLDASTGTYRANISDAYLIVSVPNGGYVAATIIEAASLHMAPKSQPHPLTAHFEFLTRSTVGPVIITIEVVKPGRQLTTLHATLHQQNLLPAAPWTTPSSRKCITAYLTMTSLPLSGLSLTRFTLPNPPPPTPDFSLLISDTDPNWTSHPFLTTHLRAVAALQNLHFFAPRPGTPHQPRTIPDMWIRLSTPNAHFTTSHLPFVIDSLPFSVEALRPAPGHDENAPFKHDEMFWYPTVVMNLEVKRPLEERDEVEWLFLRMKTREIRDGRFDLEVVVLDVEGRLVCVGSQVGLVLGMERNVGGRGKI
ncbi:thioesterase-like superfamily-domain-containing protein [Podospora aff. communis PSN243]|uniref:Thioesterase-like superfamily-domain-containing protein n=1 Tax=Podospora aff. communis PSN243 TaxID=3040156 RepID=A0AAV9G838_9PEZI|nr:thioesterase-like superfamily-domain-containing protein [Podospora aff. communis PSN243]